MPNTSAELKLKYPHLVISIDGYPLCGLGYPRRDCLASLSNQPQQINENGIVTKIDAKPKIPDCPSCRLNPIPKQ
jgi:hypothetical protein